MSYADRTLTCRECGANFVFTAGEQEFYASRGLENAPSRCPECRAARRAGGGRFNAGPRETGSPRPCGVSGKLALTWHPGADNRFDNPNTGENA
jgi:hypothetical protein